MNEIKKPGIIGLIFLIVFVMSHLFSILPGFTCYATSFQPTGNIADVSNSNTLYLGKSFLRNNVRTFTYGASGIEVNFSGTELSANFVLRQDANHPQRIAIFLDGKNSPEEAKFMMLNQGDGWYLLASNLPSGNHTIMVLKNDRGNFGRIEATEIGISQYAVNAGGFFLPPNPQRSFVIEVFGDSITDGSGIAADQSTPNGFAFTWANYTGELARYFNAEIKVMAACGMGLNSSLIAVDGHYVGFVYPQRNWPVVDEGAGQNTPYNHTANPADVVIINLGTNDVPGINNGDFTTTQYRNEYIRFMREIKTDCPSAYIIGVLGAMDAKELFPHIQAACDTVNAENGSDYAFFIQLQDSGIIPQGKGYDNCHPSRYANQIYGLQIAKLIQKVVPNAPVVKLPATIDPPSSNPTLNKTATISSKIETTNRPASKENAATR